MEQMKTYVTSLVRWEEEKLKLDVTNIEFRIQQAEWKTEELESRMSITEHECIKRHS